MKVENPSQEEKKNLLLRLTDFFGRKDMRLNKIEAIILVLTFFLKPWAAQE